MCKKFQKYVKQALQTDSDINNSQVKKTKHKCVGSCFDYGETKLSGVVNAKSVGHILSVKTHES